MHFVEVGCKPGVRDVLGQAVKARLEEDLSAGVKGLRRVAFIDVYRLECLLSPQEAERIGAELLRDPITQVFAVDQPVEGGFDWSVTVSLHQNVTDNVGIAAREGIEDLLGRKLDEGERLHYDRKYLFWGDLTEAQVRDLAGKALANDFLEHCRVERGSHA